MTAHPTGPWVTQQARNLFLRAGEELSGRRFLIRDRDAKFTGPFDEVFTSEGLRVIRTPVRAPKANAHAERFVGTLRQECLDWMLIFGRRHLESVLSEYAEHYNRHRPHRSLSLVSPNRVNQVQGEISTHPLTPIESDGSIAWVACSTSTPWPPKTRAPTIARVILRCTKKLLDVIRPEQLASPDPDPEDWYANLSVFDGRKCLLLTHAESLFTIFEPDVRAARLRATHQLVTQLIERELLSEGLPRSAFGNLEDQPLGIAKTADRRVLGCMNDMALHCEYSVADAGSLAMLDLLSLNRQLHRNINSSRGYKRPIDSLIERTVGHA